MIPTDAVIWLFIVMIFGMTIYFGSEHRGIGITGDWHVRITVLHLQLSALYFIYHPFCTL